MPKKLVLAYVDSMRTDMLELATRSGAAPTFTRLLERGMLIPDCVSSFPSVTPVACGEIATGVGADRHWISGMNWYHRLERRYVEYGSSFEATRAFGMFRALYDLVYNMNLSHLNPAAETLFERLDDAGLRTACTPFLIYRGRHRHQVSLDGLMKRASDAVGFRHATWGPAELFYGELYASRRVPCRASSIPGNRDEYSACCAAELAERDLYDFLLLSLPDNDHHSHRHGPEATVESIARADRCFTQLVEAAGGLDGFLTDNALILTADHAQTPVHRPLPLATVLGESWHVLQPSDERPEEAELAVSPTGRAAGVYLLASEPERGRRHALLRAELADTEGVDLIAWLAGPSGEPLPPAGSERHSLAGCEAVIERDGGELRFRPGSQVHDLAGGGWDLDGDLGVLDIGLQEGLALSEEYPDPLARLWSALAAPQAGDILVSAALGYECVDWGGSWHAAGGSHGSLQRGDSLCPLLLVGCGPDDPLARKQWTLRDIAEVVYGHFGL